MGIYRRYQWDYKGTDFQYEITWPDEWLSRLEGEDHDVTDPKDYRWYMDNDPYESELEEFFVKIMKLGIEQIDNSDDEGFLQYLLSFVQHLNYYSDRGEYPRYPMETVIDKGGDCEDSAILMAFIAKKLGYDCAFLEFQSEGFLGIGAFGHVDLGISESRAGEFSGDYWKDGEGNRYYYASCNGKHRKIGNYSGKWGNKARVYPV